MRSAVRRGSGRGEHATHTRTSRAAAVPRPLRRLCAAARARLALVGSCWLYTGALSSAADRWLAIGLLHWNILEARNSEPATTGCCGEPHVDVE